jgi:iron complex outermembrane receptor protein
MTPIRTILPSCLPVLLAAAALASSPAPSAPDSAAAAPPESVSAAPASGLATPITLSLHGSTLEEALAALSAKAGIPFSYSNTRLRADRIVDADFKDVPLRSALEALLGASLKEIRLEGGSVVLLAAEPAEATASAPPPEPVDLEKTVIKGARKSYKASKPSSSLRISESLLETPQSIVVVDDAAIKDQQAISLDETFRNVSGTVNSSLNPQFYAWPMLRGFNSMSNSLRNGLSTGLQGFGINEDMSYVERVEYIKGPAGFMLAQGEPGGMYNVVTKKPLKENRRSFSFTGGSFGMMRGAADITGPAGGGFYYRLNVMDQSSEGLLDHNTLDRLSVAPVLRYEWDENTAITAEYNLDYVKGRGLYSNNLTTRNGERLPRSFSVTDPNIAPSTHTRQNGYFNLTHRLTPGWSVTAQIGATSGTIDAKDLYTDWGAGYDSTGTMLRTLYKWDMENRVYVGQAYVNGSFATGPVKHALLAGVDAGSHRYQERYQQVSGILPLNVDDPVYGIDDQAIDTLELPPAYPWGPDLYWQAFYLQDAIRPLDWLELTLGGRLTYYRSETDLQDDVPFTPRLGLALFPIDGVTLYGLYEQAFLQQAGKSFAGDRFDPLTGDNIEAGIKSEWLGGRFSAQAAVFQITKNNVLTEDPEHPTFSLQTGQVRSRGLELDLMGALGWGFSTVANYALTESMVTETRSTSPFEWEGKHMEQIPTHNANLWVRYAVPERIVRGLGAGLGINYQQERWASSTLKADGQEALLPDYFNLDAALYYAFRNLDVSLNIYNLTDEDHYNGVYDGTTGNGEWIYASLPGTTFRLTTTVKF